MTTFKSQFPDIDLPKDVNLWSWLLASGAGAQSSEKGFTDATTKEHLTYEEIKEVSTYVSTSLASAASVTAGDVVAVFSRNSIWYPVATLSAVRIGAMACGISPEYTVDELCFSLKLSKAKVIFTTNELVVSALAAADKVGVPRNNIFLLDSSQQHQTTQDSLWEIRDLAEYGNRRGGSQQSKVYKIPRDRTNHDVCAFLCFSSGTTGLPKAVMISHANIIAQCLQIQQITPTDHDKILAALPFNHITGIVHQLHLPILLNANVYVLPKFDFEGMLHTVAENKIKELLIVPPILIRLVRQPEVVAKYDLSHVQRFSSGAAPLSKEILRLLEQQFPGTGFKQGYGMTESCSAICSHPPSKYAYKYAEKVGMVVASTEVRITHPETGQDCNVGESGEIWARGPQVVMGYLDNPKATAETINKNGFLRTGDIGSFDEEDLLNVTDRMKEMIKVKGIGVAPAELENFLLGHPAVADCAVCGILDERTGERTKAFVVLANSSLTPREEAVKLLKFSRENSARHKAIKEIEVVKEIPKSTSGKILRKELRKPQHGRTVVVVREELRAKM